MQSLMKTAMTLAACSLLLGGCIKYVSGYKKSGAAGATADASAATSDDTSSTDTSSTDESSTDTTDTTDTGSTDAGTTDGAATSTTSTDPAASTGTTTAGSGSSDPASTAAGTAANVGSKITSIPTAAPLGLEANICVACHSPAGEAEKVVLNAKSIPLLDEAYKGAKKANHVGLQTYFEQPGRKKLEDWLKAQK